MKAFEVARNSQLKDANFWFLLGIKLVDPGYYGESISDRVTYIERNLIIEIPTGWSEIVDLPSFRANQIDFFGHL